MSLPVIVNIAIGLAFIYLMLSLLASEIQELIATILQWRAKHLKDSIVNLFASDVNSTHSVDKAHKLAKSVYQHPLIRGLNQESKGFLPNLFRGFTWILSRLYQKITGQTEGEFGDRRTAPSYIPPESFATALLEQLGTKYFVERLVEAKFSDFVELILAEMGLNQEVSSHTGFQQLNANLHRIEKDFIEDRIDLESAVTSIGVKLDEFLAALGEDKASDLKDWKARVFVSDLERVIKNAGLRPTLQEIVDSIDKDSKTYRTYKKRFARYEQERAREVGKDLNAFEEFLSEFFEQLAGQEISQQIFAYRLASIVFENPPDSWELPTEEDKGGHAAEEEDRHKIEPEPEPIRRTKTPMSRIEQVILTNLVETERRLHSDKVTRKKIQAFRQGFAGKSSLSNWRDFDSSGAYIFSRILPFSLLFLFGFFVSAILSDMPLGWLEPLRDCFRNLLLGQWSGLISILCLFGIPLLCFAGFRSYFAHRRWSYNKDALSPSSSNFFLDPRNQTLTEIFDNYSVDDLPEPDALPESIDTTDTTRPLPSETEVQQAENLEEDAGEIQNPFSQKSFAEDIALRIEALSTAPTALRYNEIRDLGRSFRRYYLKLTLENADVDLPFIPSSIKQSLAVLIRRAKINTMQAEEQILQLKSEVEDWYDRSMERASGVYRRNAKGIAILIGIGLAIAVNANSIHILDQLAFNDALRESIADSVVQTSITERSADNLDASKSASENREALFTELEQSLDDIDLPIGWDPALIDEEFGCDMPPTTDQTTGPTQWNQLINACIYDRATTDQQPVADQSLEETETPEQFFYPTALLAIFLQQPLLGLRYVLGWLITGVAISMGASFWFDLLSKLIKVRNTGRPVSTAPDTVGQQGESQHRDVSDTTRSGRRRN